MKYKAIIQRSMAIVLILCAVAGLFPSTALAASKKPRLNMKRLKLTVDDSFQLRVYNMKNATRRLISRAMKRSYR